MALGIKHIYSTLFLGCYKPTCLKNTASTHIQRANQESTAGLILIFHCTCLPSSGWITKSRKGSSREEWDDSILRHDYYYL